MATYSQGKAFSMISYMFMLSVFNDDESSTVKGVNKMTVMPGGHGLTGAWSWGMPISSPNPDAGWEFIKWVESPDIAMQRALAGGVPAQQAPYENQEFLTKYPWMPQAKEMIASGEGLPAVTKQAQLVEIMGRHLSDVVSGAKPAQDGMDARRGRAEDAVVTGDEEPWHKRLDPRTPASVWSRSQSDELMHERRSRSRRPRRRWRSCRRRPRDWDAAASVRRGRAARASEGRVLAAETRGTDTTCRARRERSSSIAPSGRRSKRSSL